MTYNLIDEPWIKVKYLDGTITEVGIRKCFEDAQIIDDIIAPSFRRDTMHIYYVPTLRLLTTIVMAAYFKPEQDFASRNFKYLRNFENGIYTDVIKEYLDKFHDRFDVLSADYPFLQNKDILGKVKENDHCITWNPFIPGDNNKVFGKNRSQDLTAKDILSQFDMSVKEYAYYLPTVSGETSLEAKAMIYISLKGNNLSQTIRNNVFKLNKSIDSDNDYDRPIWELERVSDVEKIFSIDSDTPRQNNKLICSFYPGISIMHTGASGSMISGFVRTGKETIQCATLNQIETKILSEPSNYCCDCAVSMTNKDNNKIYKPFNVDTDFASSVCIASTAHIEDDLACNILCDRDIANSSIRVFFRVFDGMKVSLMQCGEISGNNAKTWELLQDIEKHNTAVKYSKTYYKIRKCLTGCIADMFSGKKVSDSFIKKAVKNFSDFMEHDFFNDFTVDLVEDAENAIYKFVERSSSVTKQIVYEIVCFSDNMIGSANAVSRFNKNMKKLLEGC